MSVCAACGAGWRALLRGKAWGRVLARAGCSGVPRARGCAHALLVGPGGAGRGWAARSNCRGKCCDVLAGGRESAARKPTASPRPFSTASPTLPTARRSSSVCHGARYGRRRRWPPTLWSKQPPREGMARARGRRASLGVRSIERAKKRDGGARQERLQQRPPCLWTPPLDHHILSLFYTNSASDPQSDTREVSSPRPRMRPKEQHRTDCGLGQFSTYSSTQPTCDAGAVDLGPPSAGVAEVEAAGRAGAGTDAEGAPTTREELINVVDLVVVVFAVALLPLPFPPPPSLLRAVAPPPLPSVLRAVASLSSSVLRAEAPLLSSPPSVVALPPLPPSAAVLPCPPLSSPPSVLRAAPRIPGSSLHGQSLRCPTLGGRSPQRPPQTQTPPPATAGAPLCKQRASAAHAAWAASSWERGQALPRHRRPTAPQASSQDDNSSARIHCAAITWRPGSARQHAAGRMHGPRRPRRPNELRRPPPTPSSAPTTSAAPNPPAALTSPTAPAPPAPALLCCADSVACADCMAPHAPPPPTPSTAPTPSAAPTPPSLSKPPTVMT